MPGPVGGHLVPGGAWSGGVWSWGGWWRPPRLLLLQAICILLECILVFTVIRITGRMGPSPILSVIHNITIGTMVSNDDGNNGYGLKTLGLG